ncbi:hypothetical protein [Streptomonospora wellingtoniae]|uniref:Uncharacterized protein n=1 Tax=Streptomonospora wellingtoniae TaxID=3075544 RepID=A0ABU2KXL2_9ACTN|nr:hypothetical protein [Streptomonospora sp. DSM 45055]MDT0303993.1 hypothetical protein [Streptomonospora sp. DSM 45055]
MGLVLTILATVITVAVLAMAVHLIRATRREERAALARARQRREVRR